MKLQTKIGLGILPLMTAVVIALGAFSNQMARDIHHTQSIQFMTQVLDTYVNDILTRAHETLQKHNLTTVPSFVTDYQNNAALAAAKIKVINSGHIFAIDNTGKVIFPEHFKTDKVIKALWRSKAKQIANSDQQSVHGHIHTQSGQTIYTAHYFQPWEWVIFYSASQKKVTAVLDRINYATYSAAVVCVLVGYILIMLFFRKFVVRPVAALKDAAAAIARREPMDAVFVHSDDELGELAVSLKTMAREIQHYIIKEQTWRQELEKQVQERTIELQNELTERLQAEKTLQESEVRFRNLFQNMRSGGAIYEAHADGADFIFKDFNRAGEQIENVSRNDLIGQSVIKKFPGVLECGLFDVFQRVWKTGRSEHYPVTLYKDERLEGWRENYIYKLASGEIVVLYDDVSEQKEVEEALYQAKENAEAANRAKSEFLANMSHELRTPLNAILGFSQLMAHDKNLAPGQRENLKIVRRSGRHLLDLINQVLDLAKIEAGRTTLDETNFNLCFMLDEMENTFRLHANNKGLVLQVECAPDVPRYVRADAVKLRQVLINLLGNAVKFTKEGGVTVRVGTTPVVARSQEGQPQEIAPTCLLFEISDTGPGIAPDELNNLFKAFAQTETGLASGQGTGLGLVISSKFVEQMGGAINVRSEVGRGTTFTFKIMAGATEGSDIETGKTAMQVIALEPNQPRYRILIADDKEDNRLLLVSLLTPLGFELHEAGNGREAVEMWEAWRPHLICMDMRMPVMDGREAVKTIRERETNVIVRGTGPDTVIIAITASAFDADLKSALEAGCDAFLGKPIHENDLFNLMAKHLGMRFIYKDEESNASGQQNMATNSAGSIDFEKVKEPAELMMLLNSEILTSCQVLKNVMIMSDVKRFGEKIEAYAEKHKIKHLHQYGKDIVTCADNFDTVGIEVKFDELANEIERLNQIWEEFHAK